MRYIIVVIFACFIHIALLQAQDHEHVHLRNEIGFSGGGVYTFNHNTWGGGMHLHYFRALGLHSRWSLGGGIEQVWADGGHFTIGAGVKCMVVDRLNIGLMPGVTFFKHDEPEFPDEHEHDDTGVNSRFSLHIEAVYDLLHWEKFHLGPAIDYSLSKDDSHLMIGIHAAYCF